MEIVHDYHSQEINASKFRKTQSSKQLRITEGLLQSVV
jgi:hypothetical protein